MRIATWNLKQAVAPKKPLPELWQWAADRIEPDVIAFTEGKVPKTGVPDGWTAEWIEGGIDPKRRWGTVTAARRVHLQRVPIDVEWPATVIATDVFDGVEYWGTVVGFYAITLNRKGVSCGHGGYSSKLMLSQLQPLLESERGRRLIVAGDMNLWPVDVAGKIRQLGLIDLVEHTRATRSRLDNCANCEGDPECGHLWTHKNGNSPNALVQQIDYILATPALAAEVRSVYGGAGSFPDAWQMSDHAPVVAEFG